MNYQFLEFVVAGLKTVSALLRVCYLRGDDSCVGRKA